MSRRDLDTKAKAYARPTIHDRETALSLEWYAGRIMDLTPKGSLLELGLGQGAASLVLSGRYSPHLIVEGSGEVIRAFRQGGQWAQVQIVEALFEEFEPEGRFDLVVMGFVLEHVDDPGLVLRRYRDFLSPGGSLYVVVPNSESLHRRLGQAAGLLDDLNRLGPRDLEAGHKRYFNLKSITKLLEESGLAVTRAEGLMLKPLTSAQLAALDLSEEVMTALFRVGQDLPELSNALFLQARSQD
ncbi:MAG: class I SAM-dependent methyltransferase [Deltaproteobacteria bacterium]|nr:class I SAM-dependent methyltransferase [Deltaproteobacteria bacterium]